MKSLNVFRKNTMHREIDKTYTRRGAKVQNDLALLEEAILLVELDKLESSSSTISFLFRKSVELVQTTFTEPLFNRHLADVEDKKAIWC
jgi:hypothetical protein